MKSSYPEKEREKERENYLCNALFSFFAPSEMTSSDKGNEFG